MTQPIIEVKNLSKEYIISHNVQPYYTLRDSLMQLAKKPFEIFSKKNISNTKEKFLALDDVSFSVMPGEVIGIIGRNGAGKSTLLKILSQITPPSKGSIHLRGRVASLLEVGTGFHPELTGRENIFLNGAILGMTQKEIKNKFDEIVEFAGIEKFLDTPVKRYSSGMYVRLAFAVAAHLEPEILVVDEVLAVGDAEFQKKCLGKMGEVAKAGRTVLFVSHNMAAIQGLCQQVILLEDGIIKMIGETGEVIRKYVTMAESELDMCPIKSGIAKLSMHTEDLMGVKKNAFSIGNPIKFIIDIDIEKPIVNAALGLGILDINGNRIVTFHTLFQYSINWNVNKAISMAVEWPECILCAGVYSYEVALFENKSQMIAVWQNMGQLIIIETDYFGTGKLPDPNTQGRVVAKASWHIKKES